MKKQLLYQWPKEWHQKGFISALKWYLNRKNKFCKSFCPQCEFFFRCQEDSAWLDYVNKEM